MLVACSKDPESPDVKFSVNQTTVAVGEPVAFTVGFGADGYALYTGDAGHDIEKSALKVVGSNILDTIYRKLDPNVKRFEVDFSALTEVPASVSTEGNADNKLAIQGIVDGALKMTIPAGGANWGNNFYIYPNVGLGSDNTLLTLRMKFSNFEAGKMVRMPTVITINGVETVPSWSPSGRTYTDASASEDGFVDFVLDLNPLIESWNANAGVANGAVDRIMMVVGGGPSGVRYEGDIFIEKITLGVDGYYDFDKGMALTLVEYEKDKVVEYTYTEPGVYNATLVVTNVGAKKYSGDGYQSGRADEIVVDEYGIERVLKTIQITVTE